MELVTKEKTINRKPSPFVMEDGGADKRGKLD